MRKQWTIMLAGLAMTLTGCSQAVEKGSSPSMGTLRHRGKSYDLRYVVTADAKQRRSDPFLQEMDPDRTYARSNDEIWAGSDVSNGQVEDNLFIADLEARE